MFKTQRSIMAFEGDSFFTGSYVRSNILGLSNHTRDYPNVTTYLATFLKQRASLPFASVGLVIGCNTAVHKDVHNQVGASNILLRFSYIMGPCGLKTQSAREVRPNTSRMGHVTQLSLDNIVSFNPKFYHQAHLSAGSIVLVGYTPRGLRNLSLQDRAAMASLGFPHMPATSTEFWSLDESRRTLVRHHPVSQHTLFVPSKEECLPVPLTTLSQVAAVQQTLDSGVQGTKLLAWRHPPAQPPAPFVGRTVFMFRTSLPWLLSRLQLRLLSRLQLRAHAWARGGGVMVWVVIKTATPVQGKRVKLIFPDKKFLGSMRSPQ